MATIKDKTTMTLYSLDLDNPPRILPGFALSIKSVSDSLQVRLDIGKNTYISKHCVYIRLRRLLSHRCLDDNIDEVCGEIGE